LHVPGADADANAGESQLSGAVEAERDHERHPTPRTGSCRKRRCRPEKPP
jgi:hypothetical protein